MAGLVWFELEIDFPDHPKSRALAAALREPLAIAYVVRLWAYCYRFATDIIVGNPQVAATLLEEAAGWRGEPGAFASAAVMSGIVDGAPEGLRVHGVAERLGPHLKKRTRDQKRAKKRRGELTASRGRRGDAKATPESGPAGVAGDRDRDRDRDPEAKEAAPPRASAPARDEGEKQASTKSASPGTVGPEGGSTAAARLDPTPAPVGHPTEGATSPSPEQVARDTARACGTEHRLRAISDADLDAKHPATARLLGWLRDRGAELGHATAGAGRSAIEQGCTTQDLEQLGPRVLEAWKKQPRATLGWFMHEIAPALGRPRSTAATDIRFGVAPPAPHEAFPEDTYRAID